MSVDKTVRLDVKDMVFTSSWRKRWKPERRTILEARAHAPRGLPSRHVGGPYVARWTDWTWGPKKNLDPQRRGLTHHLPLIDGSATAA